jgi:hypothetical protein
MPEMLQFCGQRYTVTKRASKLCDTITWSGMRRMEDAVHLTGVRCDGSGHGGCQAGCLVYWKEAWLKRVDDGDPAHPPPQAPPAVTPETLAAAAAPRRIGSPARRPSCCGRPRRRSRPWTYASTSRT